jgi:hypothetical protein
MIRPLIKIVGFVLLVAVGQQVMAQQGIGVSYEFGQILPHAPGMENLKKEMVQGFGVRYYFPNKTASHWRELYNYPDLGFGYAYTSFGNPSVLGASHSVHTFVQFPFLKARGNFYFGFKGLVGLAYINKIYDEVTNPDNIAVSQHMNINAEAGFYAKWRI